MSSIYIEDLVHGIVDYLVPIIDGVTILLIFWSFIYAIVHLITYHTHLYFNRPARTVGFNTIRVKLGEYLLFALEIFLCADIMLSVADPSLEHLTQLGIIVIIRTAIAFFLQKEIEHIHSEREARDGIMEKKEIDL